MISKYVKLFGPTISSQKLILIIAAFPECNISASF